MKQVITTHALRLLAGAFIVLSFTQCTKDAVDRDTPEARMESKSLNLKKEYRVSLAALNHSGVHGTATLALEGNQLTVTVNAMGLEAGKPHPQHIHGFMDNSRNSTCPTMAADTNGDGVVDLAEGLPSYGPVLLELGPMPMADAEGRIMYTHTFEITKDLLPLQNRAIVLHGLTVNGEYIATLPVACGQVMTVSGE